MSAVSILDTAVSLARQGVHQDKAKNYAEAARCYREAIATFASIRSKSANAQVAAAIDEKISQYRQRLRKIDHYLLSKADLSRIFKSVVDYHVDSQQCHTQNCTDIQKGLQLIEKAKRKDAGRSYGEALRLYEEGMSELLQVAIGQQQTQPETSEKIRFKCLLIHERVDEIRNGLETGKPIKDRKDLQLMDNIRRPGFDSCSASPEPVEDDDESRIMSMEEVRSGSNFSLAKMAPEMRKSGSLNSSDFGGSDGIPLANMDQELSLSSDSLDSYSDQVRRMVGIKSADPSVTSSNTSLAKHKYRSFHMSAEHLLQASFRNVSIEEKDRNVSEVTYICDTVVPDDHLLSRPDSRDDSASDSGISDPCSTFKRHTPSATPPATPTISEEASPIIVPPECFDIHVQKSLSSTPKTSHTSLNTPEPLKTPESRTLSRNGSTKQHSASIDELRVLSSEDVVDGAVKGPKAKPQVEEKFYYGQPRPEYVPPRSFATREDLEDENLVNKGCYYFVSCLDAFWIL